MTSQTKNLELDLLSPEQAQKHVTLNEALIKLDAVVHLAVISRSHTAAPAEPVEGERYMPASGATGVWQGKAGMITVYSAQIWNFITPKAGFILRVHDENRFLAYDGTNWQDLGASISELHNLKHLGVGTSADSNNPFSAKLNNALWTARTVSEGGTGDMRFAMNKQDTANTLSMLWQSNYTGHAEIGLVGGNNISLKTSADGLVWNTALAAESTTGKVSFPQGVSTVWSDANFPVRLGENGPSLGNSTSNVDEFQQNGWAWCNGAAVPEIGVAGMLMTGGANSTNARIQMHLSSGSNAYAMHIRRKLSATSWSGWIQPNAITGLKVAFTEGTYNTACTTLAQTSAAEGRLNCVGAASTVFQVSVQPADGSSSAIVGIGRYTQTTNAGGAILQGYKGDNSNSLDWRICGGSAGSYFALTGNFSVGTATAPEKLTVAGNIAPATDNVHTLGTPSLRFGTVYAATGTINTSDRRVKTDIQDSNLGLDFVNALRPCSFKRLDGETLVEYVDVQVGEAEEIIREWEEVIGEDDDSNPITEKRHESHIVPTWGKEERACGVRAGVRTHYGFIAQEVKAAVDACGVSDFAGHTLADKDDPDSLQGLRPDQLLAPIVKAIQELSMIVEVQAQQIADFQARGSA